VKYYLRPLPRVIPVYARFTAVLLGQCGSGVATPGRSGGGGWASLFPLARERLCRKGFDERGHAGVSILGWSTPTSGPAATTDEDAGRRREERLWPLGGDRVRMDDEDWRQRVWRVAGWRRLARRTTRHGVRPRRRVAAARAAVRRVGSRGGGLTFLLLGPPWPEDANVGGQRPRKRLAPRPRNPRRPLLRPWAGVAVRPRQLPRREVGGASRRLQRRRAAGRPTGRTPQRQLQPVLSATR